MPSHNLGDFLPIKASVGKYGKNNSDDVFTIQMRLVKWIMFGQLPQVEQCGVDGICGTKTKRAIGAFQFRFLGMKNPDCKVDPNGKTFHALMGNALPPLSASELAYGKYLLEQKASAGRDILAIEHKDESTDFVGRHWGEEVRQWVNLPANGVEAREFAPPPDKRDRFKTVFVWKSENPAKDCPACRNHRVQVQPMARDDYAYWYAKTGSHINAEQLAFSNSIAIRDYRDYIVNRKLCPEAAYLRLVDIGKDVTYQMLIGMYQMASPRSKLLGGGLKQGWKVDTTTAKAVGKVIKDLYKNDVLDSEIEKYVKQFQ